MGDVGKFYLIEDKTILMADISELSLQTWVWMITALLMLAVVAVAIWCGRPKEKIKTTVEVLTIQSVQTIWAMPSPPPEPSRPLPANDFVYCGPDYRQLDYENAHRTWRDRMTDFHRQMAANVEYGKPVGYPDYKIVKFDGPSEISIRASLDSVYRQGDRCRVRIERGETTGKVYFFEVLDRFESGHTV